MTKILSAGLIAGLTMMTSGAAVPQETAQDTDCDRRCLYELAGTFMDNMVENYTEGVPFADDVRITENGADIAVGEGIWENSLAWSTRHTFVDAEQGGIGAFGVIRNDDETSTIVGLRMKVEDREFTEVETLTIAEGSFPLFRPDGVEARPLYYNYVPEEKRSTREELIAIADGYFNGLATGDPSALSFHPDCNRLENGFQTTRNPPLTHRSCADLYPFSYMHSYRAPDFPVIDTEKGLVLGVTAFDMPEQDRTVMIRGEEFHITSEGRRLPRTLFLYELFKVEDGQIMIIDAVLANFEYGTEMGWNGR